MLFGPPNTINTIHSLKINLRSVYSFLVMEMSPSTSTSSLNTEETLILGNPPDHLFNPSMSSSGPSSSLLSTDRFDPIKNYPSLSSLEIDSKNHSHQTMEEQRGGREERELQLRDSWKLKVKGRSSIKKGKSAIKERLRKRKRKEMMDQSFHSTPLVPEDEKRKSSFGTPQLKRLDYRDMEWDRDRDFELMPPPGTHKKSVPAISDVDQPIDPNEPTYCVCHQVSFGDMIACDMDNCQGGEWFHYSCIGLTPETRFKGNWYCPTCKLLPFIVSKAIALESEQLESK